METNIFALIDSKYDFLSKTFKIIANYVKENYKIVPFLSIKELTGITGVSTASVTRFAQELGFTGYNDFQKEIRKILQKEITPMKQMKEFISTSTTGENVLKKTIDLNIQILESTYSDDLYQSFLSAVDLIKRSRKIYIIGLRSSYTVAYYLSFMLKRFRDNVELISIGTGDVFDNFSFVKKNDLLIAMSFTKYSKYTANVVDYFKKNGNKIIAVTDSQSSPVALKADITILAKSDSTSYSFVSAMTILNALVVNVGLLDKEKTLSIMEEKEKIAIDYDVYV